MRIVCEDLFNLSLATLIDDNDCLNQRPITELVNKKLRLLLTLTIHVVRIIGLVPLFHDVLIDLIQVRQIIEP